MNGVQRSCKHLLWVLLTPPILCTLHIIMYSYIQVQSKLLKQSSSTLLLVATTLLVCSTAQQQQTLPYLTITIHALLLFGVS
jgi:hypothetical protein